MGYAVRAVGLTKKYGRLLAIDNVDLDVFRGVIFGLIGPNGAGKSTLTNLLSGLLAPSAGTVHILGEEMTVNATEIKKRIGIMAEDLALYESLTGQEHLYFSGSMFGLDKLTLRQRSADLLELFELGSAGDAQISTYSAGMKKKLALAAVLLHDPELLFLDEPFTGIDPRSVKMIKDLLKDAAGKGKTVFLTSHILPIVEELCEKVAICHKGKIVFSASTELLNDKVKVRELRQKANDSTLEDLFLRLTEATGDC